MRNATIFIALSLLLLAGCKKDQTGTVESSQLGISFTANYDGAPLVINEGVYDYNGNAIRFSKVNFYLSDVTLGGTELSDVNFIDITNSHLTEASSMEGTNINFSKIPVDDYPQLAFGIGVSADLNRTKPSDYATSHPLGSDMSGEYWEAWDSYIFVKIEGQYDVDGDGFDADDVPFSYHVGQDEMYRRWRGDFETPISLEANTAKNIEFSIDVKKLLMQNNGELITLSAHDPNNQQEIMRLIMDNFEKALQFRI